MEKWPACVKTSVNVVSIALLVVSITCLVIGVTQWVERSYQISTMWGSFAFGFGVISLSLSALFKLNSTKRDKNKS